MKIKRYAIVNNGDVVKGPWGDTAPKSSMPSSEDDDQESGELVDMFLYEDLSFYRRQALDDMYDGDAFFELLETEDGPLLGVLIKLADSDYASFALKQQADKPLDIAIGGGLQTDEDETIAMPVVEVEIEQLGDEAFVAPVMIAAIAEDGRLEVLRAAAKEGVVTIGLGSSKGLLESDIFVDDDASCLLISDILGEGIAMFDADPWDAEAEEVLEESFWEDEEDE